MQKLNRRQFLGASGAALAASLHGAARAGSAAPEALATRGVVIVPEDLTLGDWPERAKKAGLTTIALHHQNSPQAVIDCLRTDAGRQFIERCRQLGLQVEYELHAIKELLPRELFAKNPELFRMNEKGERTADANCCVHSERALEIIAGGAAAIGRALRPTTGRYFYWGDDGKPWCGCPRCRELSPSEQALVVENRICRRLREADPEAQLAHLAYVNSLAPPRKIKPDQGVFLEYAPIRRRYDQAFDQQRGPLAAEGLDALDANLEVFPKTPPRSSSTGSMSPVSPSGRGRASSCHGTGTCSLPTWPPIASGVFATSPRSRHGSTPATGTGIKTWRSSRNMVKDY